MNDLAWTDLVASSTEHGDAFTEVSSRAISAPAPPQFVFGSIPASLNSIYYNEVIVHPVGVYTLADAGIAGDGFPIRAGQFLTAPYYCLAESYIAAMLGNVKPATVRHESGRAICLSGPGYLIYGHWLVDILPKLYALDLLGIDLSTETLVMPANTPGFGLDWLKLLRIQPRRVLTYHPSEEILTFDQLVLPLPFRANSRASPLFPAAVASLLARTGLDPAAESSVPNGRVYVSRQNSGRFGRQLENAEEVEREVRDCGYSIVYPELLSLPQQIALFRHARFLVGEYGSALHASMFAGPDCVVCALRGTSTSPGFLQSGLCQVAGQRFGYVFGSTVEHADGTQSFRVERTAVRRALDMMNIIVAT